MSKTPLAPSNSPGALATAPRPAARTESALLDRVPPQSIESEVAVLGSMMLDREVIGSVLQIVSESCFYRSDHRIIYQTLIELYESNQPVDLVLLREQLKSRKLLDAVGGVPYLLTLVESVPSTANAEHYARIVRDKALLRELINACNQVLKDAFDDRDGARHVLDQAEHKIFEIASQRISGSAAPIREILARTFEIIESRDGKLVTGLPTGYFELDEITGGLQEGEMIVLAARPSMGKTSLALNLAEHVAVDNQIPVAIFSLEMSRQQLAERLLAARARMDSHRIRKGLLNQEDYQKLSLIVGALSEAPLYIDDFAGLTILELRAKCRRLALQHGIKMVVLDYLQLMDEHGAESRQQAISTISRGIKSLARELNLPVVVLSQLNRSVEGREGHKPRMSDLRESGSVEQDADVVMLLHRESYYDSNADPGMAELIMAKQRNGPTGTIEMAFIDRYMRFENLSRAAQPPAPASAAASANDQADTGAPF